MKRTLSLILSLLILNPSIPLLEASSSFDNHNTMKSANPQKSKQRSTGKLPFKAGDGVLISTFPDTTSFIHGIYAIDDQGYIELPITGKIKITSMSIDDLKKYIQTNFRSYLRSSSGVYVKPLVRISLLGGFQRPGLYYVDYNSSLWEAIRLVGGPVNEEGIYKMHWQRDGEEKGDDLTSLFEKGISLKKMGFKSGDQIWTPSPDARTFWTTLSDIMPLLTFMTTLAYLYLTYQRDMIYFQQMR